MRIASVAFIALFLFAMDLGATKIYAKRIIEARKLMEKISEGDTEFLCSIKGSTFTTLTGSRVDFSNLEAVLFENLLGKNKEMKVCSCQVLSLMPSYQDRILKHKRRQEILEALISVLSEAVTEGERSYSYYKDGVRSAYGILLGWQPVKSLAPLAPFMREQLESSNDKARYYLAHVLLQIDRNDQAALKAMKSLHTSNDSWVAGFSKQRYHEFAKDEKSGVGGVIFKAPTRKVRVSGHLSREAVVRVVRKHLRGIQYCYEKNLLQNPKLAGKIIIEWTINMAGSVSEVLTKYDSLQSPVVAICLAAKIKRWKFPQFKSGVTIVSYPFIFNSIGF